MVQSVSKEHLKDVWTEEGLCEASGEDELCLCCLVRGLLSTVLRRNAGTTQGLPQTKQSQKSLTTKYTSFIPSVISLSEVKCNVVLIDSKYQ